jgi:hypothetical protein
MNSSPLVQVKHFGGFVRYQSDLPPPDSANPARMVLTTLDQAVYRSTGQMPNRFFSAKRRFKDAKIPSFKRSERSVDVKVILALVESLSFEESTCLTNAKLH